MRMNPILRKELTVQSRSYGLPLMVSLINAVLLLAGLLGAFGILTRMQLGGESEYGAFLKIYAMAGLLAFALVLFITPSLTAGSICSERQTQTLDLLLTTQMSPAEIIFGTFSAAAWMLAALLCSAVPALLVPLMYGGVTLLQTFLFLLVLILEAAFLLIIGLFASARTHSVMHSTAIAYGILAALIIGTLLLALLARPFCEAGKNYTAYVLVLNPLVTVAGLLTSQIGEGQAVGLLFGELGLLPDAAFLHFFVWISLSFQAALAFALFVGAVLGITPERRKHSAPAAAASPEKEEAPVKEEAKKKAKKKAKKNAGLHRGIVK